MVTFRHSPRWHDIAGTWDDETQQVWSTATQYLEQRDQRLEAWLSRTGLLESEIASPADREHLIYDAATGTWVNDAPLLDDNSDVVLTSPAIHNILKHNGTNWVNDTAAWTAHGPTITGWGIGNGFTACTYVKMGRKVTYRFNITAGSTTTFAAALTATLPFTPVADVWGMFGMGQDFSAVVFAPIMVRAQTAATVTFYPLAAVAQINNAGLQTTVPWTWAANDVVSATFDFESTT